MVQNVLSLTEYWDASWQCILYMLWMRFPVYFVIYYYSKKLIFINSFNIHPFYLHLHLECPFYSYQITWILFYLNVMIICFYQTTFNLHISAVIISSNSFKSPPEQKIFVSSANSTRFNIFDTLHLTIYIKDKQFRTQHWPLGDATSNVQAWWYILSHLHKLLPVT